ncbi:MAG: hypothetical protein JWO07_765 [Candidatus Saccharibacteria bacterium]|nr:hypothetical protein [Candidatus Saccharibacteria bacterium]
MNKQYKQKINSGKGFTIIEVVLVLAIAGLIFLMVFIALPALQRGQRDTQRKQDLSRISVQMTNYISSSKGSIIPENNTDKLSAFVKNYLRRNAETPPANGATEAGDDYKDPTGPTDGGDPNYTLSFNAPKDLGQVGYYAAMVCDPDQTDGVTSQHASPRSYAFTIRLESQNIPFCIDNKS